MDIQALKNEIALSAKTLEEHISRLMEFDGRIPQIDLDIALGSIRKLYEDLHTLNKLNKEPIAKATRQPKITPQPAAKTEPQPKAATQPAVTHDKPAEAEVFEKPRQHEPRLEEDVKKEKPPAEPPAEEPKKPVTEKKEGKQGEIIKPARKKPAKDQKRTIDMYTDSKNTLADKFMSNQDESIAAKMQKNKITDLKKAIGINENFLFIKDLFEGNKQEYDDAITQLNGYKNRSEALGFLRSLQQNHKWADDNPALLQMIGFIEKRY